MPCLTAQLFRLCRGYDPLWLDKRAHDINDTGEYCLSAVLLLQHIAMLNSTSRVKACSIRSSKLFIIRPETAHKNNIFTPQFLHLTHLVYVGRGAVPITTPHPFGVKFSYFLRPKVPSWSIPTLRSLPCSLRSTAINTSPKGFYKNTNKHTHIIYICIYTHMYMHFLTKFIILPLLLWLSDERFSSRV